MGEKSAPLALIARNLAALLYQHPTGARRIPQNATRVGVQLTPVLDSLTPKLGHSRFGSSRICGYRIGERIDTL